MEGNRRYVKIREKLIYCGVMECWSRLSAGVVYSPSLGMLKTQLDAVLGCLVDVFLLEQGWAILQPLPACASVGQHPSYHRRSHGGLHRELQILLVMLVVPS